MEDPCKDCPARKWYAKRLDMHFWGEDCPYECTSYKKYKKFKEENQNGTVEKR